MTDLGDISAGRDLRRLVMNLPGFEDEPERSNEKILEAIQMLWIEELE